MLQPDKTEEAIKRLVRNPDFMEFIAMVTNMREGLRDQFEVAKGEDRAQAAGGSLALNIILKEVSRVASGGNDAIRTPPAEPLG